MTTETQHHIDIIRKACIAANGHILDLKFGCEVILVNEMQKRIIKNKEGAILTLIDKDFEMVSNIKEIIGSKIGIADVLLALGTNGQYAIDTLGLFCYEIERSTDTDEGLFRFDLGKKHRVYWNLLDDDLTHQDPSTLAWLAELLG